MIFDVCHHASEAVYRPVCRSHDRRGLTHGRSHDRGGWVVVIEMCFAHDQSRELVHRTCHDRHGRHDSYQPDQRQQRCHHREVVEIRLLLVSCGLLRQPYRPRSVKGLRSDECFNRMGKGLRAFSCINSNFLASRSSFGTPCGLACALKQRFHSSLQNGAVSLSRKPVSWIWRDLMSGCWVNMLVEVLNLW